MANQDIHELLRTAIQAARSGNHLVARGILQQITAQEPDNELAWIWMATVAETVDERRQHLRRVLQINPANERARAALERLEKSTAAEPPPSPSPSGQPAPAAPSQARQDISQPDTLLRERDSLLQPVPPRRTIRSRIRTVTFWLVTVVSALAVAVGIVAIWYTLQEEEKPAESAVVLPTPTAAVLAGGVTGFVTPTPLGGSLRTLPPRETMPPTWTPTMTLTPSATPEPTSTPLPLRSFGLVVAVQEGDDGPWTLHRLAGDGSNETRVPISLTTTGDGDTLTLLDALDPDFSPDGTYIVFTGRVSGSHLEDGTLVEREFEELFIVPAEGGEAMRLTNLEATAVRDAEWSPDGQRVAFASNVDGDYDLYVIDIDTGVMESLTRNEALDREPAWSPDGQWIAFTSDRSGPGSTEIWRMPADVGAAKQLTENVNSSFSPAWSPDSQSIVFLSNRRVNTDLYIMTWDGAGERALIVRDVESEERDPSWSPDGRWILFSSNRDNPAFALYVIRPDGNDLQRIASGDGDMRYATWNPIIHTEQ